MEFRLPLFFFFLMFPLACSRRGISASSRSCSSSCGSLVNITYPFRLTTDPSTCGDPDYEITCHDNQSPIMMINSNSYYVTQIAYASRTIRLLDTQLSISSCAIPPDPPSIDELASDPRYRGHVSDTYTSFFSCRKGTNISSQDYRRVPCLDDGDYEVYVSYGVYILSTLDGSCRFMARVPTIYQPVLHPSYDSIAALLQSGFDLGWSVDCRDCAANGGTCLLKSMDVPFVYMCSINGDVIAQAIKNLAIVSGIYIFWAHWIARFIFAPVIIFSFLIHKYLGTSKEARGLSENLELTSSSLAARSFSYLDIVSMTNNFRDKIGTGALGTVVRSQISQGMLGSVKILEKSKLNDDVFLKEIMLLGSIHHANIIRLLGVCHEENHRALVFEFLPHNAFEKALSWDLLLEIVSGIARGIEHLHAAGILHLNIKPSNVLLDYNYVPKLSDFGVSNLLSGKEDLVSVISFNGAMKYVAPELITGGVGSASGKSDVYSYGMLLLDLVKGRMNCTFRELSFFPSWVYDHLSEEGRLDLGNVSILDASIARKICIVGLSCIQKNPSHRPSVAQVLQMMKMDASALRLPPQKLHFPEHSATEDIGSDSSRELLNKGKHSRML